jgi:phosphate transport system permease protein
VSAPETPDVRTATPADPAVGAPGGGRVARRNKRRARQKLVWRDLADAGIAIVAAMVVVAGLALAGVLDNPIVLAVIGYAVFVLLLLLLSKIPSRARRRRAHDIDLVDESANQPALSTTQELAPTQLGIGPPPALTPDWARPATSDTAVLDIAALERANLEGPPENDRPIKRSPIDAQTITEFALAAVAAAGLAWTIRFVHGDHALLGTFVWWYVGFLVISLVLVRDRVDAETALDRVMTTLVWSTAILVTAALGWMITYLLIKGVPGLSFEFFTKDMSNNGPLNPGGGALHAIVGSIEQVGIATLVVVPVSIMTAIYLHEMKGIISGPVRFIVDAMAGLPSIVAGLFIFAIWVSGRGFTGFSASLALIVLMLPTVTRTAEEVLRTIPDSLREASLALGAPQWRVVTKVVVPTARSGLVTACLLGIARAIGETAPLILTASGSASMNWNPFHGPQEALPLYVWDLIRQPNAAQNQRAWTGMLLLVLIVLVLFVTARIVANRGARKLGRAR